MATTNLGVEFDEPDDYDTPEELYCGACKAPINWGELCSECANRRRAVSTEINASPARTSVEQKQTISFAAACRYAAANIDYAAEVGAPQVATERLQYSNALRELARLIGELQRATTMLPDERETLEYQVMTALRTGFQPPPAAEVEDNG